jgi:orotate phosphoribosyltransferase
VDSLGIAFQTFCGNGFRLNPLFAAVSLVKKNQCKQVLNLRVHSLLGVYMNETTCEAANALYHSGCLKFGSFRIKSGTQSPYYIDLACLLSSPKDFCTLTDIAADEIEKVKTSSRLNKLASIELKGALLLPSIACRTNLPCVVVRKEEKTYGATGRLAGADIVKGDHVLFFDDVVSEGLSKLEGIKPLEQLGAHVENILVVVDREQGGRENLEKMGYKIRALVKVSEVVKSLFQDSKITKEQTEAVLDYIKKA